VKVKVVTLQVTPEESERLALTATVGTLLLSLRNKGDSEHILTASSTDTKNGKPSINSQHILSGTSLARLLPQPILKKKGSPAPPPKKATFTTKKRKSRPASSTTQKSKKTGQVVEIIKGVERSIQSL
jgi:Flp pilus assembly protein CpaB